jgi:hypothetical protein
MELRVWAGGLLVALVAVLPGACSSDDASAPSTTAPPTTVPTGAPGEPPPWRVLVVGDSTLLAVEAYDELSAFRGFDVVYDAKSCRTIGIPSCGYQPKPPNVVNTVEDADGTFDAVVIMAGYDEWWTTFPDSFDRAVDAARAKGAGHVVWLTYTEGAEYINPDGDNAQQAFTKNNQTLRDKVASGAFPDVVLADWQHYSERRPEWFEVDGIHLTLQGADGVADYISREIAFLAGRACAMPHEVGGAVDDPCPAPDDAGPPTDVRSLYR